MAGREARYSTRCVRVLRSLQANKRDSEQKWVIVVVPHSAPLPASALGIHF